MFTRILLLMSFSFAASALAQDSSKQLSTAEPAIRELVQKYMDARDQRDPAAVAGLFTSDADQLVSSGEWRKGRNALVTGALASSQSSGGRRKITVESVRFLSPDIAIADGRYELTELAGNQTRRMWTTIIVMRIDGAWRITAIRNMLPAPPVPTAPK